MTTREMVYWDGQFVQEVNALIPVSDSGFLFGQGAFTTLRVSHGVPDYLSLHLERLEIHCRLLNVSLPRITSQDIINLITHNDAHEGIWRLKILATPKHLLMTLKPYQAPTAPYRLCLYPEPVIRPTARVKSLAYVDRLWIKEYAHQRGFDEAIVFDPSQNILEAAFSNLFWRMENELFVPDLALPLLCGVMLQVVMRTAEALGMSVRQVRSKWEEVPLSAQLFTCNSLSGPWPITAVEGTAYRRDVKFEEKLARKLHLSRHVGRKRKL